MNSSEDRLTNPTWRPPGTTKQEVAGLILRARRYASISHYFVGPFPGRPSFSATAGSKSLGHDSPANRAGFQLNTIPRLSASFLIWRIVPAPMSVS